MKTLNIRSCCTAFVDKQECVKKKKPAFVFENTTGNETGTTVLPFHYSSGTFSSN